ncbi:hypothetical protein Lal_00044810 [Lupinus albus]|nr:hypothetical protein Lal_00044810 [Lupinus albus]
MAQFTAQGRLKLLFNGGVVSCRLDHKDPFEYKCRSVDKYKRNVRSCGYSSGIYYASSMSMKTNRCNVGSHSISGVLDAYDDEDDDMFEDDGLSCFRGLVLDISYSHNIVVASGAAVRNLNHCRKCIKLHENGTTIAFAMPLRRLPKLPVNVVDWKRAICLEFMEKADVLEYYAKTVNSPSGSFYIPAVLRVPHLLQVVKRRIVKSNLSRKNILFRDNYTCQYCSLRENLTIDHVVPIALGGEWEWENLVTACAKCNAKKGQKTLEEAKMKLMKVPKAPKEYDILAIPLTTAALRMLSIRKGTPEEWRQYLRSS